MVSVFSNLIYLTANSTLFKHYLSTAKPRKTPILKLGGERGEERGGEERRALGGGGRGVTQDTAWPVPAPGAQASPSPTAAGPRRRLSNHGLDASQPDHSGPSSATVLRPVCERPRTHASLPGPETGLESLLSEACGNQTPQVWWAL